MTIKIDLMDLSDVGGNPQRLANFIIASNPNIDIPVPIEEISKAVGIQSIDYKDGIDFEGALVADDGKTKGVIVCNNASNYERKRFTVAHELGHFLIPFHSNKLNCSSKSISFDNRDKFINKEQEANCFASHILLPQSILKKEVDKIRYFDLEDIEKLRRKFAVSYEALIRALINCTNEPMAFIFAENGIMKYFVASSDFPKLGVWPKEKLPIKLQSYSNYEITETFERDGDYWLSNRPNQTVYEQNLIIKNRYTITMLTFDES